MKNMFLSQGNYIPEAMGYNYVDKNTETQLDGQLIKIDQSAYLTSHSEMQEVEKPLMQKIYTEHIIQAKGFKFGRY